MFLFIGVKAVINYVVELIVQLAFDIKSLTAFKIFFFETASLKSDKTKSHNSILSQMKSNQHARVT